MVDKDRTSCLLATGLEADRLVMLTDVDHVCLNFQQPAEQPLGVVTADQAETLTAQGHFPPGSMQPKMEAAIEFVRRSPRPGAEAIITRTENLLPALQGDVGTHIVGPSSAGCP